jgi:nitrite reductase/ring-hydroxylating ferredoxin subunit
MSDRTPSDGMIVVGSQDELPPGAHKIVRVRNMEVGVYNVGGRYFALHNMCPHQFGPLCKGPVGGEMRCNKGTDWKFEWVRDGEILTCPWHGLEFDLTTGRCLAPKSYKVRQFPVSVVDGEIRVQAGAARAPAE